MVENLEEGRDRFEVAGLDRLTGDGQRALEPEDLKQRVIRQVVDLLPLERVGDDFSDPLLAQPFLARDLGNRRSDLHPGKDALAPERLGVGVELWPRRLRAWVLSCPLVLSAATCGAEIEERDTTIGFLKKTRKSAFFCKIARNPPLMASNCWFEEFAWQRPADEPLYVMAGLVPAIHELRRIERCKRKEEMSCRFAAARAEARARLCRRAAWMAGTSPAMTART